MAADALNYPYIRVRDIEWLKRTLLIFPHVVRMTPGSGRAPADHPLIAPFTYPRDNEKLPLLRPANLALNHVHDCQLELKSELQSRVAADPDAFHARFGKKAARSDARKRLKESMLWQRRLSLGANFQIHPYKLGELANFLVTEKLAWEPKPPESADFPGYLEMHHVLGEGIMATLATACAEAEGLQVVTEFPTIHGKLIGTPRKEIFGACIDGPKIDGKVTGERILEFIVYRQCKVDLLAQEGIYDLHEEREALADFRGKLEELATKEFTQPIYDEGVRNQKIKDLLADLFRDWDREQAVLAGTGRRFFGEGALAEPHKFIEKIGETLLKPETGLAGAQGAALTGGPVRSTWR